MKVDNSLAVYDQIYHDMRSMIMTLSGASDVELEERAVELGLHYDRFLSDYEGSYIVDAHVGFTLMMVRWPSPWPAVSGSTLNGLTLAQFFLAWAWEENEAAETYLASAGSSAHAEVVDAYGIESNSPHGSASSWLNTS